MERDYRVNSGFSLVELLIIMAIICILAITALPAMGQHRTKALNSAAISDLKVFKSMVEGYYLDNQSYPSF